MNSFDKLIFLPSGGLLYSPFVLVKPVTSDFLLFQADKGMYDSMLDYQLAVIRRYVSSQIDLMKLVTQDFFYIWLYLYVTELEQSNGIFTHSTCSFCKTVNDIFVKLEKLDVTVINKFESGITPHFLYSIGNVTIKFRLRLIEDNITFGHLLLNSEHENEDWYMLALFVATQIESMQISDVDIPQGDFIGALQYNVGYRSLLELYSLINAHNSQFGIKNAVYYHCQNCKHTQKAFLFDNLASSVILPMDKQNDIVGNQEKIFEDALQLARFRLMTFNEYMERLPIKYGKAFRQVVGNMEFMPLI